MFKRIVIGLLGLLLSSACTADEASLRKTISEAYPKAEIKSIVKTNYSGLYEVFIGGQIIYTDDKFSFLIAEGHLVDPKNKRDITGERMEELSKIDFSVLPLKDAVKVVKGNGSRTLVVFSDPDCPFCKRLEQNELVNIDNVTVYTFLYPLTELHPDSSNKAKAIWCDADSGKAWTNWISKGELAKNDGKCDTPLEKNAVLAAKVGVNSTPTMFFADGRRMTGAYPAKDIEAALDRATPKK